MGVTLTEMKVKNIYHLSVASKLKNTVYPIDIYAYHHHSSFTNFTHIKVTVYNRVVNRLDRNSVFLYIFNFNSCRRYIDTKTFRLFLETIYKKLNKLVPFEMFISSFYYFLRTASTPILSSNKNIKDFETRF